MIIDAEKRKKMVDDVAKIVDWNMRSLFPDDPHDVAEEIVKLVLKRINGDKVKYL